MAPRWLKLKSWLIDPKDWLIDPKDMIDKIDRRKQKQNLRRV